MVLKNTQFVEKYSNVAIFNRISLRLGKCYRNYISSLLHRATAFFSYLRCFKSSPSVISAKDDETASHASHSTTYRSLFNLAGRTRKVTHRLDACFCSFYIFNKITIGKGKANWKKGSRLEGRFFYYFFFIILLPFKNKTYFTVVNLSSYGHITIKFFQ